MNAQPHSILVNELCQSLCNEPDAWFWAGSCRYRIRHRSGVEAWIAVGEFRVEEPRRVNFGWRDWLRLRRAFKQWRRVQGNEAAARRDKANAIIVLSTLRGEQPLRRAA